MSASFLGHGDLFDDLGAEDPFDDFQPDDAPTTNIARDARDDILSASAVCRGDRACLIRSVAAMLLCRQRGYAPTWCVGVVATPPFAAHAWIEADDRIVDEPIDASYLRTFYRVGACARA